MVVFETTTASAAARPAGGAAPQCSNNSRQTESTLFLWLAFCIVLLYWKVHVARGLRPAPRAGCAPALCPKPGNEPCIAGKGHADPARHAYLLQKHPQLRPVVVLVRVVLPRPRVVRRVGGNKLWAGVLEQLHHGRFLAGLLRQLALLNLGDFVGILLSKLVRHRLLGYQPNASGLQRHGHR